MVYLRSRVAWSGKLPGKYHITLSHNGGVPSTTRELLLDFDSEGEFDGFELSDEDDTVQNDENTNNGDNFSVEN